MNTTTYMNTLYNNIETTIEALSHSCNGWSSSSIESESGTESEAEKLNEDSLNYEHIARSDYPSGESDAELSIRVRGYETIEQLYQTIESSNKDYISGQRKQYQQLETKVRLGDLSADELPESPNNIQFAGEAYGSYAERLLKLMAIVNPEHSPFYTRIPPLKKAQDSIEDILNRFPTEKSGAQNGLDIQFFDETLNALENFSREAAELDSFNYGNHAKQYRVVPALNEMIVIFKELKSDYLPIHEEKEQQRQLAESALKV